MKHLYLSLYEMNNTWIWRYVELADCCSYVNTRCFFVLLCGKISLH